MLFRYCLKSKFKMGHSSIYLKSIFDGKVCELLFKGSKAQKGYHRGLEFASAWNYNSLFVWSTCYANNIIVVMFNWMLKFKIQLHMVFNRSIYFPIYEWGVLWESITTSGLYYYYITSRIKARVYQRNSVLGTFLDISYLVHFSIDLF